MSTWKRIKRSIRHQLGLPLALVQHELLGQNLVVREGTIRGQPDYDDAWVAACALHAAVVFDVGANVGYDSLLMLCAGGRLCNVVVIEANVEALVLCADNLLRNGFGSQTRFIGAFASDGDDEEVQFWTVGTGSAGSMYGGHAETAFEDG